MFFRPSTLQSKFLSGLAIASLVLGIIFATGFYFHMRSVLEEEVHDKAELIFSQVDAVQNYVRKVLRPTMYETLPNQFVIQAMSSSYISRAVMDRLQGGDGHIYRRVAISARNEMYEANTMERSLVEYFRQHPEDTKWKGYKNIAGNQYYVMARPVVFKESCMRCHGTPDDAPQEIIDMYGDRGFNHQVNSIGGVDLVGLSVSKSVGTLQRTILGYFSFFALAALVFFSTTNLLFKVLVVNNIKRLSAIFHDNLEETGGSDLLAQMAQRDEIEELESGMQELNSHLYSARAKLKDYAENLKGMVEERTKDLTREASERREDVALFVHLLADMRASRTRGDLWRLTLPEIGKRFNASRVSYICTFASQSFFSWPDPSVRPELPEEWIELLTNSEMLLDANKAIIPVESSAGNAEGMLCMYWDEPGAASRYDQDLLQALGRQLGTAAENLTALDNLMRQMDTLQSIVEGITDPLILMDARCQLITANQAARELAESLSDGKIIDGNILKPLMHATGDPPCALVSEIQRGTPRVEEVLLDSGRSFAISLYPVDTSQDMESRVVVYARETTLERRMLSQMQQSEKMITVGKLAAGLAHEINNPLGVILCYAELLKQNISDEQQHQDVDVILRHTRQAQRVLKDLLNFARPKTSTSGVSDAGAVAGSIVEVFSVQAAKRSVKLLATSLESVQVAMGEHELEQVLSNLVLNALDAVEEGRGEVTLKVERKLDTVALVVADNGPGIDAKNMANLFDPFFSTKEIGAGTGLGLAIVYGMVTDAGGSVDVGHSEILGGAEFVIHLPFAQTNMIQDN